MTSRSRITEGSYALCSRAQEAVWFAEQAADIAAANNLPLTLDLEGRLDVDSLNQALTDVIDAHPELRTRFAERGGRLVKRELEPAELETLQLAVEAVEDPSAVVAQDGRTPLDLFVTPFTLRLLRSASDRHVLYASFHHAIFDGTSKDIFVEDLAAAYRARLSDGPIPLVRRRSYDHGATDDELEAKAARYWEPTLAAVGDALQIAPSAHRADPSQATGESLSFDIAGALKARIDALGRQHDVSTFVILLGATQILQHVYAGRGEGGVATLIPLGTRTRNTHDVVGMFVNEVPFYGQPSRDLPVADYLHDVAERVREVALLRRYPFNYASARFGRDGDPHALLPRFGLSYRKATPRTPAMPGLRVTVDRLAPVYGRRWGARFRFLDVPGALLGCCEYDTAMLHDAAAERMVDHLVTLLEGMVADPTARLSELSPLPAGERRRLVSEWNATRGSGPRATVQELVEAEVERRGDRPAVVFEGHQLTYRELNRQANVLAHQLIGLGAGPDARVGIYLERGLSLVVAVLAVAKAGAGHLPLDPSYPRERLTLMVEECDTPIIITERSLRAQIPDGPHRVLCIDAPVAPGTIDADRNPPVRAGQASLAYVIYTSGSTGRPKGAELVQRAVVNLIRTMCDKPGLEADDVFLSVTTLSFDIGTVELLAPLTVGARVVIAPTETATDGRALVELMKRSGATVMFGTPSRWRLAVAAGWTGGQTVMVGGEALRTDLAGELIQRGRAVWNIYGPTETTVFSTRKRLEHPSRITIGRPVANTQLFIRDQVGDLAPTGIPGELCIAGDGLARGYVSRPALTAERFPPNPFGSADTRLYRTGDLVRCHDDGEIEFLGRIDDQVKIRGFRVEPGEIEAALQEQPGIQRAVVVARGDPAGDKRLVAYIIVTEESLSVREIRARLRERLPDFMVPAACVVVADLPLNPNGKIDRDRLPAPDLAGQAEDAYVAPRSVTESVLASIWARVLDVERVGVHDDFFELGGHSLLAAEVVGRAREALATEVSLRDIFTAPTVADMAVALEERAQAARPARQFPRAPRHPLVGG